MQVYRITLSQYANSLQASGRPARWNGNHVKVIYTSSSNSLACLENVVHRSYLGLSGNFTSLTVHIPDKIKITEVKLEDLLSDWQDFESFPYTQNIGNAWIKDHNTAILKVPSAIIRNEHNYLLNPNHPDFAKIELVESNPFIFDSRING